MSGSVTPARRPREDDESGPEDFDVSIDGQDPVRSSGSKRARLDVSDGQEDDEAGQLLPDSYRRSPKGKTGAVNGLTNGYGRQEHQAGSIVRVALHDFVTYSKAEFLPGPNLNMIIGPNGTGKSTLVCAICLGLGWATSQLGRAKELGEFVKHGAKKAEIEIELAADPAHHTENQVITTRITKDGNKADYFVNGKKSNRKGVQAFARSFSIQVDNLCQFLPQDRVVEFAALSPVDLLTQTERAAAPEYMSEWHDELKRMRKDQKQHQVEQQSTMETLKNMENRQRLQEADVQRLRERSGLQERIAALEKLKPFPEYAMAKKKHLEAKQRKKEAEKELHHLERKMAPNLRAVEDKTHYVERIDKVVTKRGGLVERGKGAIAENKKKMDTAEGRIQDIVQEIEAEKNNMKATRQSIPRFEQQIRSIQKAMQTSPAAFDTAEMNERIRDKSRQINDTEDRGREISTEIRSIKEQVTQRERIIEDAEQEKESLHSQAGQQASKLRNASHDAAKAWDWIQANLDQFQGDVFGPPIVECNVKDPRHASAVENAIQEGDKMAFTVTSHEDFQKLSRRLYDEMNLKNINIRVSELSLSAFQAPMTAEQLQRHGLHCYILDLVDGPPPVLAMLCDNQRINQTAFAEREISEEQYRALQRSSVSSWITPSQSYSITRRREYGDQATSTRVQSLRPARFFTDAPVDHQAEQEIEARVTEAKGETAELIHRQTELTAEDKKLSEDRKRLREEKKAIEEVKAKQQRALSEFNGLSVKEESAKSKLADAREKLKNYKEWEKARIDKGDSFHLQKGQYALDYASSVEALRGLHVQLFEAEILHIEAKSDLEQIKDQHEEEQRLINERKREVAQLQDVQDELLVAGHRLRDQVMALDAVMSELDREVYEEIQDWTPEQMETETQSTQARLDMTHGGGNDNTLREFERRARHIEEKRTRLNELDASLEGLGSQITDVRSRWEPELDRLVAKISEAFADNFSKIQCAGEVAVYKDEDFEQWAVQIKVKFRYVPLSLASPCSRSHSR